MVWSFTIIPRHRHFRPAYFCGCWLMTHRCLLPTQTLPHRPCRDSAHTPDHDSASPAWPALAESNGIVGWFGRAPRNARVSIFPVVSYRVALPCRPIHWLPTLVGSHVPNGKRKCSILLSSLPTWRTAVGFGASEPAGRLDLGGYDYSLGTTLRNQMLELHFDADQDCFLGQPAGSETIITFAQKTPDKN